MVAFKVYNPYEKASGFIASIDWGDGIRSFGDVKSVGKGVYGVFGTHTYYANSPHIGRSGVVIQEMHDGDARLSLN